MIDNEAAAGNRRENSPYLANWDALSCDRQLGAAVECSALMAPAQVQMMRQADTDADVIALWMHGRSQHTQRAYHHDIDRFMAFVGRPLAQVTLRDLQRYSDSLVGLADASRARALAAVKSLLTFTQKIRLHHVQRRRRPRAAIHERHAGRTHPTGG